MAAWSSAWGALWGEAWGQTSVEAPAPAPAPAIATSLPGGFSRQHSHDLYPQERSNRAAERAAAFLHQQNTAAVHAVVQLVAMGAFA